VEILFSWRDMDLEKYWGDEDFLRKDDQKNAILMIIIIII